MSLQSHLLFWAAALLIAAFTLIAALNLGGFIAFGGGVIPYAGITLTALSGMMGVLTDRRTKEGKLTRWALLAVAGVSSAFVVTIAKLELDRRSGAERAIMAAVDARKAVLRQGGIRVTLVLSGPRLLPDGFDETLRTITVRDGMVGLPVPFLGWGISSCHPDFPALGRDDMGAMTALLGQQTLFLMLYQDTGEDLFPLLQELIPPAHMLSYLESGVPDTGASATVRTRLSDQYADCRSGIRGDYAQIVSEAGAQTLQLEYLLPDLRLWRRSGQDVLRPDDIPQPRLLALSSVLREVPGAFPVGTWSVDRVVLDLPEGGVFCATGLGAPVALTPEVGAFSALLTRHANGRCGS